MKDLPKELAEAVEAALAALPAGETKGYVYLACAEGIYWKIGTALNPERRVANISHACPFALHLVAAIPHATPYRLEAEIQYRLAGYRSNGEWFKYELTESHTPQAISPIGMVILWAFYRGVVSARAEYSAMTQRNLDRPHADGRRPGRRCLLSIEQISAARTLLTQVGLEETARRLGVSESTIRRRVMRVKEESPSNAPPREDLTPKNLRKGGRRRLIGAELEGRAAELAKQYPRTVAARMLGVSISTLSRYVECTPMPGATPRERALANLARAKEWGSVVGRKRKLDADAIERGRELLKEKPLEEVAEILGVSTSTIRRRLIKS